MPLNGFVILTQAYLVLTAAMVLSGILDHRLLVKSLPAVPEADDERQ